MNLKSYLRGIGAGLIVAALVMGASTPKTAKALSEPSKETLVETVKKNEEAKAAEENVVMASIPEAPAVNEVPAGEPSLDTKEDVSENVPEVEVPDVSESDPEPEEEITPPSIDPMPEDETGFTTDGQMVEIQIVRGDSSVSVSRRMFEAGLVESAVEFDKYPCENHYDKYISVGTYEIEMGSDFETMAEIISHR